MLHSVYSSHSSNLSGDVDRNSALQLATGVGRNGTVQIPHSVLCGPDKCVRLKTCTIAVPNDGSTSIDRECTTPVSASEHVEIPRNPRFIPQDSMGVVDITRVGSAHNFAQIIDPNGIAAKAAQQRSNRQHARSAAPNETSIRHSCRGAVANHLPEVIDVMCPRARETRQRSESDHSRRFAPDKRMQCAPRTGRVSDHVTAGIDCHRVASDIAGQRAEIIHSTRITRNKRMGVGAAAFQVRPACNQAAHIDSG